MIEHIVKLSWGNDKMIVETFRIDNFTKKEMDNFLKKTGISKSNFIRICIIEKLQRINDAELKEKTEE